MNKAIFISSFNEVKSFLNEIDLLKQKGVKVIYSDGVSDEFKSLSLDSDYLKTYKTAIQNFDYDFLLKDDSFFQFSFDEALEAGIPSIRYAYFQNPNQFKSYEDFLDLLRQQNIIEEETNLEIGDTLFNDYEQFLIEQQLNSNATSVRFDVDMKGYRPMIHSTSHVHFGHNNMIRVPCNKFITPLNFVVFVLKHIYYYEWKEIVSNEHVVLNKYINTSKVSCSELPLECWNHEIEANELYLT
jgi:hypothetical protein